jgi:hypothetical protein
MQDNQPTHFIECKLRTKAVNPALYYLKQRFPQAQAIQLSLYPQEAYQDKKGIRVTSAVSFLNEIGI